MHGSQKVLLWVRGFSPAYGVLSLIWTLPVRELHPNKLITPCTEVIFIFWISQVRGGKTASLCTVFTLFTIWKKLISSGRGNHTLMIASIGCEGTELDTKQRMTLVNKIFLINWQLNNNKTFPSEDCRGITYSKQYIELVHYWVFYWYSLSPNK